jgi:hypothetical protein
MKTKYKLPGEIEKTFSALSELYEKRANLICQKIIVNSRFHIVEEYTYDGFDGGIYGHALYLSLPNDIYWEIYDKREKYSQRIQEDINKLNDTIEDEHIAKVFFELEHNNYEEKWREKSEVFISRRARPPIPEKEINNIWESGFLRCFLSHKANYKTEAAELKEKLQLFGISCFVAHDDIEPTLTWQNEIEKALFSMDVLIALMTEDFSDSNWTDQEIGVAIGRNVLIVPIRIGADPYGFIGKYQAISFKEEMDFDDLSVEICKTLMQNKLSREIMNTAYINAIKNSISYDASLKLADLLPYLNNLTSKQTDNLVEAYNENGEVYNCWGFNGDRPYHYGKGLLPCLNEMSGNKYKKRGKKIRLNDSIDKEDVEIPL